MVGLLRSIRQLYSSNNNSNNNNSRSGSGNARPKSALPQETLLLPGPDPHSSKVLGGGAQLPEYEWEEILLHNQPRDLWLVVGGNVYNVGEFMFHHPGGPEIHLANHGRDATQAFLAANHPPYALALTKSFLIGKVKPGSVPPQYDKRASSVAVRREPPREVPIAFPELEMNGERWTNFDIMNNTPSQLDYFQRFGHIYQVPLPKNSGRLVVVSDPELLDEVADNVEQFGKKVEGINFFRQLQLARGAGISVVSDSDEYQKIRRIMLPWYSPKHQRTQMDSMKAVIKRLLAAWDAIPDDKPLEMRDWMARYALEVSGRGACSYHFAVLEPDLREKPPFAAAVRECLGEALARVAKGHPDRITPFSKNDKREKSVKFHQQSQLLFETGSTLVETRANTLPAGEQIDLLSRLLSESDPDTKERLDKDAIRDQVLMHLSNGFNGPSITLTWLVAELSSRPDIEENIMAEIDAITNGDPDYDLQYADLLTMPYITQVIKETLRVYPPMPVTVRTSLREGRLGPYIMHEDDIILVGALAAQRDRRYWGNQPDLFDPEHFTPDKVAQRHRLAFIPFSVGQRQCMAQEVTFMMLRIAIFYIYNHFRLRLAPNTEPPRRATVASLSLNGVYMVRERRESKERRVKRVEMGEQARPKLVKQKTVALLSGKNAPAWDVISAIPAISQYRHIVIAFGSNFGSCARLADMIGDRSRRYGFTHEIIPLDRLIEMPERNDPWILAVATATYTGNPPSNAGLFKTWLDKATAGAPIWRNCRYLVWGLGNSQWNAYLRFPTYVNDRLSKLGATPLADMGSADVGSATWENEFSKWETRVWPILIDLAGAKPSEIAAARMLEEEKSLDLDDSKLQSEQSLLSSPGQLLTPLILTNGAGIQTKVGIVRVAQPLCSEDAQTQVCHLEIEFPENMSYQAGDHLAICPQNDPFLVSRIAELLGAPLTAVFALPPMARIPAIVPRGAILQVGNLLSQVVDLAGPIPSQLVSVMLDNAEDESDKERLMELHEMITSGTAPTSTDSRIGVLIRERLGILGLLEAFPKVRIGFARFIQSLQSLRPRYYSISSSPAVHGAHKAHLSVGLLAEPPADATVERTFYGMCSSYVHNHLQPPVRGTQLVTVNVFLDPAEGFRLHDDWSAPIIMISAGTGFAPMRAFLFERAAYLAENKEGKSTLGAAAVFNGIRRSQEDYIYRDELEKFLADGVIQHLHVAMSREVPNRREYVQQKLEQEAALVFRLLEEGAFVYICGSGKMRSDTRAAVVKCIARGGHLDKKTAKAYMARLEEQNRYRPDVWGA